MTAARVAVLGTIGPGGRVDLVPITFALEGDHVVSVVDHKPKSTTKLQRLANVASDPRVTLLVDHYHDDWDQLWWIRLRGRARVIVDGAPHEAAVARLAAKYSPYRDRRPTGSVLEVAVATWSWWSASG